MCWGGPELIPGPEWIETGLKFHEPDKEHGFGLRIERELSKSFLILIQAYVLKNLLFRGRSKPQHR